MNHDDFALFESGVQAAVDEAVRKAYFLIIDASGDETEVTSNVCKLVMALLIELSAKIGIELPCVELDTVTAAAIGQIDVAIENFCATQQTMAFGSHLLNLTFQRFAQKVADPFNADYHKMIAQMP